MSAQTSTYAVTIKLGAHTFNVTSADAPIETTVTVLDNLTIGWSFSESAPRPVQPDPVSCSLGLLTRDVANLADVDVGTPLQIKVTSGGTTVAAFAGRVAQMTASPRVITNPDGTQARAMIYQIDGVDYLVDLAELMIDFVRPAESIADRLTALAAAILAAGGVALQLPPFFFRATIRNFAAISETQQPALTLLLDHLRQLVDPSGATANPLLALDIVVPRTTAGVLTKFDMCWPILTNATLVWPPADWAMIGGKLMIDPTGGPLPGGRMYAYANLPVGLSIDGCRVELDSVQWIRSKFGAVNYVAVTGPDGKAIAFRSATTPVKLALDSTLLMNPPANDILQDMADLYLPDPDADRWAIDTVTWRPSDAELAALPWPLTPDTDTITDPNPYNANAATDKINGPTAYYAPVVIRQVPDALNAGSRLGYLAGSLSSVKVKIARKLLTVDLGVERTLPPNLDLDANGPVGGSWADLAADFPAVTWAQVDPRPSWYDARLAHG